MAGVSMLLVQVRVRSGQCPVSAASVRYPEAEVRYVESARLEGESFLEVVEVTGAQAGALVEAMRGDLVMRHDGRHLCRVTVRGGACVRGAIASQGCIPLEVRVRDGQEVASVLVRDAVEARSLVEGMRARYEDVHVLGIHPYEPDDHGADGLTGRQREVLTAAVSSGYFAASRRQSATQLAAGLGIDRSTFTRHLRSALRKILAGYAKRAA